MHKLKKAERRNSCTYEKHIQDQLVVWVVKKRHWKREKRERNSVDALLCIIRICDISIGLYCSVMHTHSTVSLSLDFLSLFLNHDVISTIVLRPKRCSLAFLLRHSSVAMLHRRVGRVTSLEISSRGGYQLISDNFCFFSSLAHIFFFGCVNFHMNFCSFAVVVDAASTFNAHPKREKKIHKNTPQ